MSLTVHLSRYRGGTFHFRLTTWRWGVEFSASYRDSLGVVVRGHGLRFMLARPFVQLLP